MIKIRAAVADDVEIFYQLMLEEAAYHDAVQHVRTDAAELLRAGFGADRRFGVLLAEYEGKVAGYVSYTFNYSIWLGADYMMIDDLYVSAQYRGRQIGEALMLQARERARAAGYPRVRWEVQSYNEGAIRFYKRLGAEMVSKGIFSWPAAVPATA